MEFMFFNMHVFCVFDGLMTVLDEDIQVEEFFIFNFLHSSLDLWDIQFEYLGDQIINCNLLDTKVKCEFKFSHFMDFDSSDNTNDLEKPGFVFLYWFLYTEFTSGNSGFNIFLDFFEEFGEKVTVFGTCLEQTVFILAR